MRRTGRDDDGGINADGMLWDLFDEGIGEDVLSDRDGKGAAEGVEEDSDGV